MALTAFIFAIISPLLAIILEKCQFTDEAYLARQAEVSFNCASVGKYSKEQREEIVDMIRLTARGVLSIASLMPSIISVVISGLAIAVSFKEAYWALLCLVVGLFVIAIILIRTILSNDAYHLAHNLSFSKNKDGTIVVRNYTHAKFISNCVILINCFLIVLLISVCLYTNRCISWVLAYIPVVAATCHSAS